MGDQQPTALCRDIYQGDPLLAPPPPELAAILERYRGQPDARLDHRRRMEEDGSTTERRRWDYASTAAVMDEVARGTPI